MFPLDTDCWVNILLFIMSNYTNTWSPPPIGPHKVRPATQLHGWSAVNSNYYPLKIVLRRFKNSFSCIF